jgi:hypothetical protein
VRSGVVVVAASSNSGYVTLEIAVGTLSRPTERESVRAAVMRSMSLNGLHSGIVHYLLC